MKATATDLTWQVRDIVEVTTVVASCNPSKEIIVEIKGEILSDLAPFVNAQYSAFDVAERNDDEVANYT